jgi:hypothetical protein
MIPINPEQLREPVRDWPMAALRQAIAAALPGVDPVTVSLVADWLLSDVADPLPPLGADQIAAI